MMIRAPREVCSIRIKESGNKTVDTHVVRAEVCAVVLLACFLHMRGHSLAHNGEVVARFKMGTPFISPLLANSNFGQVSKTYRNWSNLWFARVIREPILICNLSINCDGALQSLDQAQIFISQSFYLAYRGRAHRVNKFRWNVAAQNIWDDEGECIFTRPTRPNPLLAGEIKNLHLKTDRNVVSINLSIISQTNRYYYVLRQLFRAAIYGTGGGYRTVNLDDGCVGTFQLLAHESSLLLNFKERPLSGGCGFVHFYPLLVSVINGGTQEQESESRKNDRNPVTQNVNEKRRIPGFACGMLYSFVRCLCGFRLIQRAGLIKDISILNASKILADLALIGISGIILHMSLEILDSGKVALGIWI
jgi:hypothetical protein